MIERIIDWSARNRVLMIIAILIAITAGSVAVKNIKLDAIPDLSDVQVIVYTEWPGRAPTLVEDQVTYPIIATLSAAPKVRYARDLSRRIVSGKDHTHQSPYRQTIAWGRASRRVRTTRTIDV